MNFKGNSSIIPGVMISTGTVIGAGIFSLPMVSSGMWTIYSLLCLVIVWYINYLGALYILEINYNFLPGASFNTMVKTLLDKSWSTFTGLCIAFLLYILLYAYFSAFGNIAVHTLDWRVFEDNHWYQSLLGIIFGVLLSILIWSSTANVGRISTILIIGMFISFGISMSGLVVQIDASKLWGSQTQHENYFPYVWGALPYFLTSFGFATVTPSLYKFYRKQLVMIKKSLLFGSLLALVIYALFIIVVFGNISRETFISINDEGGRLGQLINALKVENDVTFNFALNLFSNFAIITSFLGVGLGLFDYIADKFSFTTTKKDRFLTACITFLPPAIASFFFPHGFIAAIGFAGLVSIICFNIVPFLMVFKKRGVNQTSTYTVWGGKPLLLAFIVLSLVIGACHILALMGYLSKWP